MLKQRIITAAILAAIFFAALFGLPSRWFALFALLLLAGAGYEWAKLAGMAAGAAASFAALLGAIALALSYAVPGAADGLPSATVVIGVCAVAAVFWVFFAAAWIRNGWPTQNKALMLPLGAVLLEAVWLAIVSLQARSPWLLLGVMMIVWLADTGAYFAGRKFGRRKLAPLVSPGKSWEGVIGGLICVGTYAAIVVAANADLRARAVVVFVCALLLAGISVVGDLYESWLKRQAGVKDSGSLLPGHGGVLDRIDALLPVLPLATLLVAAVSSSLSR